MQMSALAEADSQRAKGLRLRLPPHPVQVQAVQAERKPLNNGLARDPSWAHSVSSFCLCCCVFCNAMLFCNNRLFSMRAYLEAQKRGIFFL